MKKSSRLHAGTFLSYLPAEITASGGCSDHTNPTVGIGRYRQVVDPEECNDRSDLTIRKSNLINWAGPQPADSLSWVSVSLSGQVADSVTTVATVATDRPRRHWSRDRERGR
jgi:hypothetical protein